MKSTTTAIAIAMTIAASSAHAQQVTAPVAPVPTVSTTGLGGSAAPLVASAIGLALLAGVVIVASDDDDDNNQPNGTN